MAKDIRHFVAEQEKSLERISKEKASLFTQIEELQKQYEELEAEERTVKFVIKTLKDT